MEIWKEIKDYPNYQVSNVGRVKSFAKGEPRILKQNTNFGYNRVVLYANNEHKIIMVHRLVAEAFITDKTNFKSMPYENRSEIDLDELIINHKDEIRNNNNVDNLEWCTYSYNINYGNRNKIVSKKLIEYKTKEMGRKIIQLTLDGEEIRVWNSSRAIERELNISHNDILAVCNGKRRTRANYKWMFYNEHFGTQHEKDRPIE